MSRINVSRVAKSNRFTQMITITRTESEWVRGEMVPKEPLTFDLLGIVTVAQPKDLQLVPEGDRLTGAMKFITTEELYPTRQAHKNDVITWRGAKYKIITVTPDIDYGFFRSIGTRLEGDGIG